MRRIALGGLLATLAVFGFGSVTLLVDAVGAAVQPTADYVSYPAPLPPGCADARTALSDVRFDNGRGMTATDLNQLALQVGDHLKMTWSTATGGCGDSTGQPAVPVSLAAYETPTVQFDPSVDQPLVTGWSSCGAGQPCAVVSGRYQLELVLPLPTRTCRGQIDAVLGPPLAVVGPHGSYYTGILRGGGPTMLISSGWLQGQTCGAAGSPNNAAVPPNQAGVSPNNTAGAPNNTAVAPNNAAVAPNNAGVAPNQAGVAPNNTAAGAAPTTTTATTATTSQVSPAVRVAPNTAAAQPSATAPGQTTVPPAGTGKNTQVEAATASRQAALPATGRSVAGLFILGLTSLAVGIWALRASRRRGAPASP